MATVLLVEDEDTLRDSVARYLEFEGHEVLSAANGREAFDVGVSGRPDVLVADWMLRNHIHGLHVAQTLRVVDPELATVLITGFPSRDLEQEFAAGGVTQMLEKPFDLEELHRAVVDAAQLRPASGTGAAAVLEVAADGAIRFANDRARSLLTATQAGRDTAHVADLLGPGFAKILDAAVTDWVEVEPLGVPAPPWSVRTRRRHDEDGWLVALCRPDEPRWLSDPRLRILLDHHGRSAPLLPELGPVIVLERDGAVRRLVASQIERIGALCFLADDIRSALRLIEADARAQTVMIDVATAGKELGRWVAALEAARPGLRTIVTGASGRASDLLALGVDRLLDKPWRIDELVDALRG